MSRPGSSTKVRDLYIGGGGGLFSIHALWTAAKYRIPSIFVCFVNHEYRLLKDLWCHAMGSTIDTTQFVGMDFDNPNLDMEASRQASAHASKQSAVLRTVGHGRTVSAAPRGSQASRETR